MRPLIERIQALPWAKYPGFIPIAKVPKRVRDALPHPAPRNMANDGEYVYELSERYLWRTPVSDMRQACEKVLHSLEAAL